MDHPGAVAQQDSPHPHEVFLDPTGSFLVSPDLGADLLRIYSISESDGQMHECPAVNVTFGSGPRHGVFWTDGTNNITQSGRTGEITHQRQAAAVGKTMMYLANEIGGTIMSFDVAYDRSGCLDLQKTQTLVPYTGGKMPEGATPAEIRMVGEALYVSIRSDQGFKPSDSMVMLDRSPKNGTVSLRNKTDAYGKVPRTFVINRAGDLVAIGDQASSTVVIVRRNRQTGDLGEKVALLQVGETGTVGQAEGLSSVVWDE
jgi:6-phosphogluconolactonase (cycloisomerase 2 family)